MKSITARLLYIVIIFFITNRLFAKEMTILVHPFQNTGSQQYSWISAGMTASVISDLEKINEIMVISEIDRKKAVQEIQLGMTGVIDEEKAIKVGKMLGANIIFTGNYLVAGNQLRVNASLINVEKGNIEKSVKIDGTIDKIFDLQDRIVFTLMAETEKIRIADIKPIKIAEEDKRKIESGERPDMNAYELYSKGLQTQDTNPREAVDYFKQAIRIQPDYIDALIDAGYVTGNILNLFDEGLEFLKKADTLNNKRGKTNTASHAKVIMTIGSVYANKGQLDKAIEYFIKARGIYDNLRMKNTVGYAAIMNNIGAVYINKGHFDKALEYFLNSKGIYESLGQQNTARYAYIMTNTGLVYGNKEQFDMALEYFFKAKEIYSGLGLLNTVGYEKLINNISVVYWHKKDLDTALEYAFTAKGILDSLGLQNTAGYTNPIGNIGLLYLNKGQFDKAFEYFLKAKGIYDNLGLQNTAGYATCLTNIGIVYKHKGQMDKALEYFLKAKKIYDSLGLQNISAYTILMNNIKIAEQRGN